jgi:ribosome-associated translation inhibitor RaiA
MFPGDLARDIDKAIKPLKSEEQRILTTHEIEQRVSARLDTIHAFLGEDDGANLRVKLEKASLKDISIAEGIAYDKLLTLRGQPTVIFGTQEHKQLDALLPALMDELKRRGTKVELTERKAIVSVEEPPSIPA